MPPKKTPVPIDRPLSKAYLREFSGWSTAYPPGISQPSSLREMYNVMITREGAARVRPGLRSYMRDKTEFPIVGSYELFYLEDGSKAYLVAVRETNETDEWISFRVIVSDETGDGTMMSLEEAGFVIPSMAEDPTDQSITFTKDTTYVRYLQIDNKIFALSNAPEPMLMFWVGAEKKAKRLAEINRPTWTVDDKLTVVHPDDSWITGTEPLNTRVNLARNPSFEKTTSRWSTAGDTRNFRSTAYSHFGKASMGVASTSVRTNVFPYPLSSVDTRGVDGWLKHARVDEITASGSRMRIKFNKHKSTVATWAKSYWFNVPSHRRNRIAFDLDQSDDLKKWAIGVKFFRANGDAIAPMEELRSRTGTAPGRKHSGEFVIPKQAVKMRIYIGGYPTSDSVVANMYVKNVYMGRHDQSGAALDGDAGADYFWTGTAHRSTSVHHPPADVKVVMDNAGVAAGNYIASAYVQSDVSRDVEVRVRARNSSNTIIESAQQTAPSAVLFGRHDSGVMAAPSNTAKVDVLITIKNVPRDEKHYIDGVLVEKTDTLGDYFDGSTVSTSQLQNSWHGDEHDSRSIQREYAAATEHPPPAPKTTNTLISNNSAKNDYTVGVFYTFSNELGESAPSQSTIVRVQRPWTKWQWETPDSNTEPSGIETNDHNLCADQLVVYMPEEVFDAAMAAGATKWSAYMHTWGPNDPPAVTALKFADVPLDEDSIYGVNSFARLTPKQTKIGNYDPLVPTESTRQNFTDPSRGSQGLVAQDRLILVGDPEDPARISWSSGQPGEYYNFSSLLGGGSKQLTTGNLNVTACVKLWQNPQSIDTLTILNMADDGRSNAWYMQPAQITTLSEQIQVMGFEETSGMAGTTSPYGCEVLNNGLYHPIEQMLIKSTSNNYNLSHKSVSDDIENMWQALQSHHHIVSAVLDNRIYYLVHNIRGAILEDHCWGNELWVLDVEAKTPTWSRWAVQGSSLRSIEMNNKEMMCIVRPDGLFALDPARANDEVFNELGELELKNIDWYLETNTQGANRAHDAWASLQQANAVLGDFKGQLRYGIVGKDVNGMDVHLTKEVVATVPPDDGLPEENTVEETEETAEAEAIADASVLVTSDLEDFFLIRKIMKEWRFFAGSIYDTETAIDEEGDEYEVQVPRYCFGQINLVQYRYTPASVNVGYEYGSVETFEYGAMRSETTTTDSGTPKPFIDRTWV